MDTKEQKLAAARKKLRQYQKKKKKESARIASSSSRENTPNHEGETFEKNEDSLSRTSSNAEINDAPSRSEDDSTNALETDPASFQDLEAVPAEAEPPLSPGGELGSSTPLEVKNPDVVPPVFTNSTPRSDPAESFVHEGSVGSDTNFTATTAICMDGNGPESASLRSTSETLRQLSFQMSGLVQDSEHKGGDFNPESLTVELEKRNNELAVLLEQERQKAFQQLQLNKELKERVQAFESQVAALQTATTTSSFNNVEANRLREQLQVHIQTIGILVAEKSELQSSLSHSRHALEQRTTETTELQGRLDASRHRVRELETSVHDLETQNSSLSESLETAKHQLSNLQANHLKNSKVHEELRSSSAELKERLALKTEENQKLTSDLDSLKKEFDLAQVHIQQLRDNSLEDMRNQFEQLQVVYNESQNRIQFLNNSLENLQHERAQMEQEYKTYASQLASEVESLKQKLSEDEKSTEELKKSNFELEAKLKIAQTQRLPPPPTAQDAKEREDLKATIELLEAEKASLLAKIEGLERDNGQLSQMVSEQRKRMEEFELRAERRSSEEVDTTQLLQSMQSDKVAAARALSQNKQLKHQLEELQNGFVMMSNKKLELTEKLERELHMKKKLNLDISSLEEQVSLLKESLLLRERENESLRESHSNLMNHHPKRDSPQDDTPVISPQNMLDTQAETAEEALLPTHDQSLPTKKTEHKEAQETSASEESDTISNAREILSVSKNESSLTPLEEKTKSEPALMDSQNPDMKVSNEAASRALEKKFTQCMGELATLSDEKQRLEHLVQQLQMETDTVGDYITIYQFQRGVMKKRMEELTAELESLRLEKEQTRKKLTTLQDLVSQLVLEKVPSEEKLISGLYSFINSNETPKGNDKSSQHVNGEPIPELESERNSPTPTGNGIEPTSLPHTQMQSLNPSESTQDKESSSKSATVQQIMDLISEMEATNQMDHSLRHEIHQCHLCSGKLITI